MRPRRCWSGRWRMFRRESRYSRWNEIVVERVIGVAARIECIESVAVVFVQRKPEPDALGEIGIRDEVTAEGHEIGVSTLDDSFGGGGFEAAGSDDLAFEDSSELLRSDGRLIFLDNHVASYARLDDVEVGEPESVQLIGEIAEECVRIAVRHAVPSAAGTDAHGDAIASPD